jgi:hypothetical protein
VISVARHAERVNQRVISLGSGLEISEKFYAVLFAIKLDYSLELVEDPGLTGLQGDLFGAFSLGFVLFHGCFVLGPAHRTKNIDLFFISYEFFPHDFGADIGDGPTAGACRACRSYYESLL